MPLLKMHYDGLVTALEEPLVEVSFRAWVESPQSVAEATALHIQNDVALGDEMRDAHGFRVIILEFPTFKDGRAYSQARLLRERYGYTGEIRARGDVLRDQLLFMVRCGVDAFEVPADDVEAANAALSEFSFAYQSGADQIDPVWRQRLSRAAAA